MRKLTFYDRLVSFFVNAQKTYPKSFVAFNQATGEIFVHDEDNTRFNEKVKSFREKNPRTTLLVIFPEKNDMPKIFRSGQVKMTSHALIAA
jgi:hypothetical protein